MINWAIALFQLNVISPDYFAESMALAASLTKTPWVVRTSVIVFKD